MKKPAILLIASLLAGVAGSPAAAPVKPPAAGKAGATSPPTAAFGVYTMADASAEAAKRKKPISFLVLDQREDDNDAKAGANRAYWMLQDDSVVVILRTSHAAEWPKRLPNGMVEILKSTDLGKTNPKLVVMNEDCTVPLASMDTGKIVATDEKTFDKFAKEMKRLNPTKTPSTDHPPPNPDAPKTAAAKKDGTTVKPAEKPDASTGTAAKPDATPPPAPATTPPPAPAGPVTIQDPKPESWTNAEGTAIQAAVSEIAADKVIFLMPTGAKVEYEISKLSDASKKRIEEIRAAGGK